MSYTVLARRYRSATFDAVVGQNHVAQTLKKAISSDRIAHAFLFCGTRGVGKTSMARILAKALNCQKASGPTTEPCLKCNSCVAIARGDDMDVIEIDAASNTKVEQTREVVLDTAQYRPAHSRFKIFIIDEVHMLSKASFNALLKTLEEPPEHVKFILATTEPEKVLATILSRCQRYDFRSIPTREIAAHLAEVCNGETIQADADALMLVAKAGAGSMRDALSLLDRLLSIGDKHLTPATIEQLLGLPRSESILRLAEAIGQGDVKEVLTQADRLVCEGLSPDALIVALIDHFRNLLILRTCGRESNLVEVAGLSVSDLVKQAEAFDSAILTQDITILEELRRQLRSASTGRALLDATLARLAMAEQFASISDLLARLDGTGPAAPPAQKKKLEGPVIAAIRPEQSAPEPSASLDDDDDDDLPRPGKIWEGPPLGSFPAKSAPSVGRAGSFRPASGPSQQSTGASSSGQSARGNIEPVDPGNLPAVWQTLLEVLRDRSAALHSLVSPGRLVRIEDEQVVIRYAAVNETFPKMLARNGKKELVSDAFSQVIGRSIGVRFEVDAQPAPDSALAEAPSPDAPVPAAPPPASSYLTDPQRQELETDPLIGALLTELNARILKLEAE